jgi:hypothetical protein
MEGFFGDRGGRRNRRKDAQNNTSQEDGAMRTHVWEKEDDREAPENKGGVVMVRRREADSVAPLTGVRLRLQRDLFEFCKQAAIDAGDTRLDERRLEAMLEHAGAMAAEQGATRFCPETSLPDRVAMDHFEQIRAEAGEVRKLLAASETDRRKRADWLGEVADTVERPSPALLIGIGGSVLLGLTLAPSLHDLLFSHVANRWLGWGLSVVPAVLGGAVVAGCLLGGGRGGSGDRARHIMGLVGGATFAAAVGGIRLAAARGIEGVILAGALTALEVATVILLEVVGRGLRKRWTEFLATRAEADRRRRILEAAEAESARHKARLAELDAFMDAFLAEIREREARELHLEKLIELARNAAKDGYSAGVDANNKRLRGKLPGKREDDEEEE